MVSGKRYAEHNNRLLRDANFKFLVRNLIISDKDYVHKRQSLAAFVTNTKKSCLLDFCEKQDRLRFLNKVKGLI